MSGVSTHMNEGGEGAAPMAGGQPLGVPPPSYKRIPTSSLSLTPPREGSLSPSRIYPPWSRTSKIHVPVAIRQERVVPPMHRWSEEAEVARCLERVCEHGCAAVLRR